MLGVRAVSCTGIFTQNDTPQSVPMCDALASLQDGGWTEEEGFAPRRKRGRMQVSGQAGL